MKFALSLLLAFIFSAGMSQGLQESFSAACDCWTITNHYDNGQVSSLHTENALRKKHGQSTTYNTDGTIIQQENWEGGKLHGTSTSYHQDGSIYLEAFYDNGNKIGTWIFRDLDGTPIQEIAYSGNAGDATHAHYHSGVKYIEQTIVNGAMVSSVILNQEVYDQVQEEAAATQK